ncbi:hypothetical protein [Aquimarina sp. 2201CG14-23]|uniref:hypothetical protein n=1 Tax=Aquimarina mycalae TaxID=3040073 RepID=UPI0024781A6F|nr:hypothetical protein [Aquimarina sp. 2201CG14-23]MDH7446450.1 hypothetical protein [Aquimarina sp. 2201CG14-23]
MKNIMTYILIVTIYMTACADNNSTEIENNVAPQIMADVINIFVSGEDSNYTFNVEIKSPDLGCDQYADWWEIISEDKTLIHRRILAHSHVNEQPFIRSGGPVNIKKDQVVYIRAHMNNKGYGNKVFMGSVSKGFSAQIIETNFADELETVAPLPNGCAF